MCRKDIKNISQKEDEAVFRRIYSWIVMVLIIRKPPTYAMHIGYSDVSNKRTMEIRVPRLKPSFQMD